MSIDFAYIVTRGFLALAIALASAGAGAQAFPTKPIRLVVPFAPGGVDAIARIILPGAEKELGGTFLIDNRPGGGGTIAASIVAKAEPDGHTLLLSDWGAVVYVLGLMKEVPYDPKRDLVAVEMILKSNLMLVAGPGSKFSNLREMIDQMKANPGAVAIGDSGVGTGHHLALELFKAHSKLDFQIVHYKGSTFSFQDMLGGQIPAVMTGANNAGSFVRQGKLKAIAFMAANRHPDFPDIPSMSEPYPSYKGALTVTGIWAPSRIPRDILVRLNAAIAKSVKSPEVAAQFTKLGIEPYAPGLEEMARVWHEELALWPDFIRKLGITAQ